MFDCRTFFNKVGLVSYFLVISSLIFFVVYRAYGVWSFVFRNTGRNEPVFLNIVNNDAIVIGMVLLLLYFGFFNTFIKSIKWVAYLLKAVVIFIIFFYAVDVLLLLQFFKRLHYHDIFKYGAEIKAGLSFLIPVKALFFDLFSTEVIGIIIVSIFLLLFISFIMFQVTGRNKKIHGRLILICGLCFSIFSFVPVDRIFLHGWAYQNLFAYNMPKGLEEPYSSDFIAALKEKREKRKQICEGASKRIDIILVIVESLSSCHSQFFSGINNYTPHLDAISKENLSFTNFFANGFTTEHGLIALFLGEVPLPIMGTVQHSAFEGFYQKESTAAFLNKVGYKTFFLTTGDLGFTNKGAWLTHIGFDTVEGAETFFYKKWPRFTFNAAPDEALFAYAVKRIENLNSDQRPYFMVLETVTSHLPFLDPEGRSNTEKAVITYVDQQLGIFYNKLEDCGFFSNGILIITSDHRIMAPLSKAELDLYGASAFARIPMVVASGGKRKGKIDASFQQTDLYSSLKWFVSDQYAKDPWNGNFLHPEPTPPFCILKSMANDYDLVYARCGLEEGYIKLQGEGTYLYQGRINPENVRLIIEKISSNRIFRSQK